jgi:hypothetical protein
MACQCGPGENSEDPTFTMPQCCRAWRSTASFWRTTRWPSPTGKESCPENCPLWIPLGSRIHGDPMENYSGNFLRILHHWNYSGPTKHWLSFMMFWFLHGAPVGQVSVPLPLRCCQVNICNMRRKRKETSNFLCTGGTSMIFLNIIHPMAVSRQYSKICIYLYIFVYGRKKTCQYPFKYSGRHGQRLRFFFAL